MKCASGFNQCPCANSICKTIDRGHSNFIASVLGLKHRPVLSSTSGVMVACGRCCSQTPTISATGFPDLVQLGGTAVAAVRVQAIWTAQLGFGQIALGMGTHYANSRPRCRAPARSNEQPQCGQWPGARPAKMMGCWSLITYSHISGRLGEPRATIQGAVRVVIGGNDSYRQCAIKCIATAGARGTGLVEPKVKAQPPRDDRQPHNQTG